MKNSDHKYSFSICSFRPQLPGKSTQHILVQDAQPSACLSRTSFRVALTNSLYPVSSRALPSSASCLLPEHSSLCFLALRTQPIVTLVPVAGRHSLQTPCSHVSLCVLPVLHPLPLYLALFHLTAGRWTGSTTCCWPAFGAAGSLCIGL